MPQMTAAEAREFLLAGTRTGKLATTRADGRPHVAPIWFVIDDEGRLVFTTHISSVKGKSLLRDPRVALTVDDQEPPYSFVVVEGTVSISEDLDEMLAWATRIGARYMGEERAEQFGRRNAVEGELLVTLTPTKTIGVAAVSS